jgi:hypothetical protein
LGRCDALHHFFELSAIGGADSIGFGLGDEIIEFIRRKRVR